MHKLLINKSGEKVILLGNEAIVRGALEAGVGLASAYPGTPSSEIGDSFAEIAKDFGIPFEYGVNEKVAIECAAGAAFSGVRSIVSFKHFGLNVATDSLFPLPYHTVKAGMVIAFADDPNCWSSGQSEQDSRNYAKIAHMPMLEPSDATECRDFTKYAFELSEKYAIPVFIRVTTRTAHASGVVVYNELSKPKITGLFDKSLRWRNMPPKIVEVHKELHETIEKLKASENDKLNKIFNENTKSDFGIIASGAAFNYVMEALNELNLNFPILKLGLIWPFPTEKVSNFIKNLKTVLIVEELDPFIEGEVTNCAKNANQKIKVHGKDLLPVYGELRTGVVLGAMNAIVSGKKLENDSHLEKVNKLTIPKRPPILCPGCPHRASFWAAKVAAGKDAVFSGDIGCYILGIHQPIEEADFIISMGAGIGISHGIKKVSGQKVIAFIGDGTFFHAGIPPLINCVYNKSNPVVMIFDNRITAMTGHQPNAGSGSTGIGEPAKELKIEEIAKACGVENIKIVNPFNVKETINAVKEFLNKKDVSIVVAKQDCRLLFTRNARKNGIKIPVFEIDAKKCVKCGTCVYEYGCPAIHREGINGNFYIDKDFCWGCSVCSQICPAKAISAAK